MSDIQSDKIINLLGDACPYTSVKSKLALEGMETGQILSVRVDNSESAANVPRSMEMENHQVLLVEEVIGGWNIVVRKA